MREFLAVVGAFGVGVATAALWVVYIRSTAAGKAAKAALSDLLLMLSTSFSLQLWLLSSGNFTVLVAWDIGSAIGTYFLVKRSAK